MLMSQTYQPRWESLNRRPTPKWFSDDKFGIFIHWGVYSVPSYAPVIPGHLAYAEWYWHAATEGKNATDPVDSGTWEYHRKMFGADFSYQDFATKFHAELFDPDHWADVLQRSGARYVVLTSKHHEGFALWPSREASLTWGRPWNAMEIGPKRDLVGDLTNAVRTKGLKMGLYYSLYEWYNPLWLSDKPRYVSEHMFPQFKDLVTRYKPAVIFADGDWELPSSDWRSPKLLAWLFNESPVKDDVVINDRWDKESRHHHGGYWTTEYTAGMNGTDHPWEESRGMAFSYGYNRAERLENYHTGRELVILLADIVSRGGNLLLDIGPAADGTIPPIMEERLLEVGSWLQVNGEAIYKTRRYKHTQQWSAGEVPQFAYNQRFNAGYDLTKLTGKPEAGKATIEAFYTSRGSDLYAILPRWPGKQFTARDVDGAGVKSVTLLGSSAPLRFYKTGNSVTVDLPELPGELWSQPAWVLKLSR